VDLPDAEPKLVVEGHLEQGVPPYVMLTKTIGYFEPTDISSFEGQFVHDAKVVVTVDGTDYTLDEVCTQDIPPPLLPIVAETIGISVEDLQRINYCAYINFNLMGEVGKIYRLSIESEGKTYASVTKIPELVPLDTAWFGREGNDSLGFIYAHMHDPDTLGNAYRWFARRINLGYDGQPKDQGFIAPLGSAFDDNFFNGKDFDFGYDRGMPPGKSETDPGEVDGYYKVGDTIVVKFCSITYDVFKFLRIYEQEIYNNGNPFAAPTTIPTNINGGALGLWAGYGVTYDTVYAVK
ncbi:MAG: DUF4249 domain-containing protein, partial [Flavobacteriales bacterium]